MITVLDVAREIGMKPSSQEAWEIGAAVRDAYEKAVGSLPIKALRQKTNGEGSHCFAVYPEEFRPMIEAAIHRLCADRDAQIDLFRKPPTQPQEETPCDRRSE